MSMILAGKLYIQYVDKRAEGEVGQVEEGETGKSI
jgi:hypothetical protein